MSLSRNHPDMSASRPRFGYRLSNERHVRTYWREAVLQRFKNLPTTNTRDNNGDEYSSITDYI